MRLKQQIKIERFFRSGGLFAGGLLLFLCGNFVNPPKHIDETNASTGVPTAATNTVSLSVGDGGTLAFDIKSSSLDGTFAESNNMTISAATDSASGYTLSIAAQSGNNTTKLVNKDTVGCPVSETRCSISPLNSSVTANNYRNPTGESVEAVRNTWGFSPDQYLNNNGIAVDNSTTDGTEVYLPMSTTATNLAKTSGPNPNEGGGNGLVLDEYTMKIGARVDSGIPVGTYENTFVVAVVGNGALYTINYADATGEATGMPANQVNLTTYETNVPISSVQPSRTGYYFAGWCSTSTVDATCSGTVYQPGDNFGIDQTASNNAITLYAIWTDCGPGYICYDDNGANSVTKMGNQNIGVSATSASLWASNFQRTGYGFLGWSTKTNPTIGTDPIYGPMETMGGIDVSAVGLRLYAVWQEAAKDGSNNSIYLQGWNGCSNLTTTTYSSSTGKLTVVPNSVIALTDERDDQVYAVARLTDGNCWMIENLRLNTTGSDSSSLSQGFGGVFNGLAGPETADFSNSTTANSLYYSGTISGTATRDIGTNDNPGYRMPRYNNDNIVNAQTNASNYVSNGNVYSYGNYYTWAAAMANTTYYDDYSGVSGSDVAGTSICPSGWRLPLGVSRTSVNLSFSKLDNSMGGSGNSADTNTNPTGADRSKIWRSFPNNFLYSGNMSGNRAYNRESLMLYWSSSAANAQDVRILYASDSDVYPGNAADRKYRGFSVRCVLGL